MYKFILKTLYCDFCGYRFIYLKIYMLYDKKFANGN